MSRIGRYRLVCLYLLATLVLTPGFARAGSLSDPKDVPNRLDIREAIWADIPHHNKDELKIRFYQHFRDKMLTYHPQTCGALDSGGSGVFIYRPTRPNAFAVIRYRPEHGDLRLSFLRKRPHGIKIQGGGGRVTHSHKQLRVLLPSSFHRIGVVSVYCYRSRQEGGYDVDFLAGGAWLRK